MSDEDIVGLNDFKRLPGESLCAFEARAMRPHFSQVPQVIFAHYPEGV